MTDQRKHRRFRARFHSTFADSGLNLAGEGLVCDFSPGGCRIMSLTAVPHGADLALKICPDDMRAELLIQKAIVRWCREQEFGVEFVTIQPEVLKWLIQVWGMLRPEEDVSASQNVTPPS